MIELMTTTCTSCGADFTPAPDAYRGGTWRTSPRCRGDPGDEVSGVTEADSTPAQARTALHFCQAERTPHHDHCFSK